MPLADDYLATQDTDTPTVPPPPFSNPIEYLIHCLDNHQPLDDPLSPALSRIGR